ncbi:MAG: NfeD family protein [Clostridiales bacterium]|nr:NfeD family protein [Clostridiales bacterium]MDY6041180.1 NfeD family protein [Candidatus Faecousia sp.]
MEAVIWLVLMVVFLAAEAATVSMVSLWFAAGSLVALAVSLLGGPIWLQVVLFLAVSAGLLACLRPLVRSKFTPKLARTNVDSMLGSEGYVTADIDNMSATGKVKLGAMEWTARSTSGKVIPAGTLVKVDKIEGVKAFVSPAEIKVTL